MNEQELLKLKRKVDEAKNTVAELKGHQTALMQQLKTEYKCDTVEEAEKRLDTMQKDIDKLDKQIAEGCKELEEKYNV